MHVLLMACVRLYISSPSMVMKFGMSSVDLVDVAFSFSKVFSNILRALGENTNGFSVFVFDFNNSISLYHLQRHASFSSF